MSFSEQAAGVPFSIQDISIAKHFGARVVDMAENYLQSSKGALGAIGHEWSTLLDEANKGAPTELIEPSGAVSEAELASLLGVRAEAAHRGLYSSRPALWAA